jgi:SAM-dependent methyltransferase
MYNINDELRRFYEGGGDYFFKALYQLVNRQALAPYFRRRLRRRGRILDAGSGEGHLATELGLKGAYFLDLTWDQVKRCRQTVGPGYFIQADLKHLPYRNDTFDGVICSNVLHYTGLAGLQELVRVTKKGGQMLLAFLEGSSFTRMATHLAVTLGLSPPMMWEAPFLDLEDLRQLDIQLKDSTTIAFIPPLFQARRELPWRGLVACELEKR